MIPVLVIPIPRVIDLLPRLFDSLDEPIGRIVVVDNTPNHDLDLPWDVEYIRPILPLGYPGGINAGISQTPEAPWWLFASYDIAFGKGDLRRIAEIMAEASGPRVVTGDRADSRMLRWAYGALNAETVRQVGLMDEWTFYPIYFDDDDYERRCHLAGVEWVQYNGEILHGMHGEGSVTIREDATASAANGRTFPLNMDAYIAKWGGRPGAEWFDTPWDLPVPLSHTVVDTKSRAERRW